MSDKYQQRRSSARVLRLEAQERWSILHNMTEHNKKNPDIGLAITVDRPITCKAEDRLGRVPFAARLAAAIAKWMDDDGLVIGLYGSWGSGKTSVKNLIVKELASYGTDTPEILEFNPWQWSGHNDVSAAFFREVLIKLGQRHASNDKGKIAKKFRRYARFIGIGGVFFTGTRCSPSVSMTSCRVVSVIHREELGT